MACAPGKFDFGLSAAQEERASRLHHASIVIDLVAQSAGGNIFTHYPSALQGEFRARMKAAGSGFEGLAEAFFWPYEMCKLGKSDLLREWMQGCGLDRKSVV